MAFSFTDSASQWTAISQGDSEGSKNHWVSEDPMEEVYLIAANFNRYESSYAGIDGDIETLAYLRTADINLATKYLDATERYLALYEPLLGEYPYSKFALVENFWETGYELSLTPDPRDSILNAADFGTPQKRKRFILIGSRVGRLGLPQPTHFDNGSWDAGPEAKAPWLTLEDALLDLEDSSPEYVQFSRVWGHT